MKFFDDLFLATRGHLGYGAAEGRLGAENGHIARHGLPEGDLDGFTHAIHILITLKVLLWVDQEDSALINQLAVPRPICVHVEKVFDEGLSCLAEVCGKHVAR